MSRELIFENEIEVILIELNHLLGGRLSNANYMSSHSISMTLVEKLRVKLILIKLDRVSSSIYLVTWSICMGSNLSKDSDLLVS
jgi:hypothetical protein